MRFSNCPGWALETMHDTAVILALLPAVVVGCGGGSQDKAGSAAPPAAATVPDKPSFLEGQLHMHSSASGDSETPPGRVVSCYEEHGFDFVVFTDHNRITEAPSTDRILVMAGIELT